MAVISSDYCNLDRNTFSWKCLNDAQKIRAKLFPGLESRPASLRHLKPKETTPAHARYFKELPHGLNIMKSYAFFLVYRL